MSVTTNLHGWFRNIWKPVKVDVNGNLQTVTVNSAGEVQFDGQLNTVTHTAPSIGAVSTSVVVANTNRKYLLLVNDSDAAIYVAFGIPAVLNQGVRINASGGSLEISAKNDNLWLSSINAISAAGGKTLLAMEGE